MTSQNYNTFNNNKHEIIIIQPDSLVQIPIVEHQCLICLQSSSNSNDEIKSINEMHFIKKPCNCICYSHHKCIETWIETNSVCPICKKPLLFPEIKHVSIHINEPHPHNSFTESIKSYTCIIVVVFILMFLGNVLMAVQPT